MLCPVCGFGCQPGQKFCMECGTPLHENAPTPAAFPPPIHIVEQTASVVTPPHQWEDAWATDANATIAQPVMHTAVLAAVPTDDPTPSGIPVPIASRRPPALAIIAGIAGVATLIASFLAQLTVTSDAQIPTLVGDYKLNDLAAGFASGGLFTGTNLQVGIILVAAVLILGGMLAARGARLGAGLVAGAALALAPFMVVIWGNISKLSDGITEQAQAAKQATNIGTIIETRPAVGFYILLGAAVLALVGMVISLAQAGAEGRLPFNRAVCAAGAIATVVAAGGQLIPQHGANFRANFSNDAIDVILISARLGVIGLVALCGVMGFLRSDRWGIGLALGGIAIYIWQWLSSITELGDLPAPPAFFNPGATSGKPTIVTTSGIIAVVLLAITALVLDARRDQTTRSITQ